MLCASTIRKVVFSSRPQFFRTAPTTFFYRLFQAARCVPRSLAPFLKIVITCPPRGKVPGQHPPLATAFEHIQDSTKHLVQIYRARLGLLARLLQKGLYLLKERAADIARIRV